MTAFTFFHAADLHLDTPFRGLTADAEAHPEVVRAVSTATFDAFDRLVADALEERPAFVVIAGDVFDSEERSVRAQLRFRDGLARMAEAGVPSYVVHGNHDPAEGAPPVAWPAGVHVFGWEDADTVSVVRDGQLLAMLTGVSHRRRAESRRLNRKLVPPDGPERVLRVAVLHCNVGSDTGHEPYVPCELTDLTGAGFDYWALGHVHERAVLHEDPWVVYPGNLQGRSIREDGPRGYFRVAVADGRPVSAVFSAADAVRWVREAVDVAGLATIDAVDRAVADAVDRAAAVAEGRPAIVRVELRGRGPVAAALVRPDAVADLTERAREVGAARDPFVWVERLVPACRPEVDLDARRRAPDLLGQVLRVAQDLRDDPAGLSAAWAELHDHPAVRRDLAVPQGEDALAVLAEAELLCADLLERDE